MKTQRGARDVRGAPFVAVMQPADFRNGHDVAVGWRRDGSGDRRVLVEREVRSDSRVVRDIRVQEAAQPALIPDDDMVEAFAANGSDQSLGVRVGVSCRMHRQQTMRHKPFTSRIPSIRGVAARFN